MVKRTDGNELGVHILGPIHGALFVAYVIVALRLREDAGWSWKTTGWILLAAVIPFGGYVVDRWLPRERRPAEQG